MSSKMPMTLNSRRTGLVSTFCIKLQMRHLTYSKHCNRALATTSPQIDVLGELHPTDSYTNITPAIISKLAFQLHNSLGHPIHTVRSLIEDHFLGYSHIKSVSPLVPPAKNFDQLGFPSDHPSRSVTDTYYVNKNTMLRTHTSAHEVDCFSTGHLQWSLTADVYRRDEIDASHYPVFHQMECARLFAANKTGAAELQEDNARLRHALALENIEMEDLTKISNDNYYQVEHDPQLAELVTANLKYSLNSLLLTIFSGVAGVSKQSPLKVRWVQAYFPWTSPSYEVEVLFRGKWLEILGCGVVRQSTLDRASVRNKIGWAFGLGLERIAMILYSIDDIRLFWSQDPRFHGQFQPGKITTFKPYSKYPPCYKDISFWLSEISFHDNDIYDLVRVVAGDLVEDVKMIDSFSNPKTNRKSICYRINYRSMDRSMSNDEVNHIHGQVAEQLTDRFGVEIR